MSVNAVSGTTLRQDLVSALRQARAASVQPIDASGYSTASQDAGTTQSTGSNTAQTSSATAGPAVSSDLMASLLQLQSDFSQMGLQTGVTSSADSNDPSSTSGLTDPDQATTTSTPVHHHHGHHARQAEPDAASDTQTGSSTATTDASASAASTGTASGTESGDGLQSLFQQMTKAIAAYATGGPAGIAAAALTSPSNS